MSLFAKCRRQQSVNTTHIISTSQCLSHRLLIHETNISHACSHKMRVLRAPQSRITKNLSGSRFQDVQTRIERHSKRDKMNATDRRRICGPIDAKPLVFGAIPAALESRQKVDLEREDDLESQISRTFIKAGLISNANGSAYIEVDGNIVSVSVYGPRPIRGSFMEKAGLSVNFDDVSDVIDELMEKKFCNYIENTFMGVINLAKYPKSGIDIFVNVVSVQNVDDLYLKLLTIISDATTLALINANIEVLDIVATGFDPVNNTVMSYVKGDELAGVLCESAKPLDNLAEIMEKTQKKAAVMKSALISLILEHVAK